MNAQAESNMASPLINPLKGRKLKVAIVHDWLVVYAGAEKVLEQLIKLWPDAEIYTTVDFVPEDSRAFLGKCKVFTTRIQKLPFARNKYRGYLPLMPAAIEQFDLSSYDLVISSSYAVAKGVITSGNQLHISYIHSPMRYAWDLQHQYLRESNLTSGFRSFMARGLLHYLRMWDLRTAPSVDVMIANSRFIARRIQKCYGRSSTVIYPPVDTQGFSLQSKKEDFYLTASRLVPYKMIPMIAAAFKAMPDKQLVVIGSGPEMAKLQAMAGDNVKVLGHQPFSELKSHMQRAKAFIFAAEEDFGITPVEAQACGTPVIAFGKGGSLETVRGLGVVDSPTGLFFYEQTPAAVVKAVHDFEKNIDAFTPLACRRHAETFSTESFVHQFSSAVEAAKADFGY
jgi:glycosyltransferase involved in cell wall biosynthesis